MVDRMLIPTAVLAAAPALAGSAAAAKHFAFGVTAAEVSSNSAVLWTRADKAGKLKLTVKPAKGRARTFTLKATKGHDLTAQRRVTGLKPGTAFRYSFSQGGHRSTTGRFSTAPKAGSNVPISFAFSGDADAQPQTPGGPPFYNAFEAFGQMAHEGNAFNINLGDTIYSDSEVGATVGGGAFNPANKALTVAEKWAKYRQNLALANLQKVRAGAGMYNHWDDHEFINDFTRAELGATVYNAGVRAFRDYMPVTFKASSGIYRSRRWGKNLEVFFLDERSFRSAKASANHVCDNPDTGQPDLAPTAPQRTRDLFGLVVPSLRQPVSPQCLAAIRDPARTMLGANQIATFEKAVKASTATWKVIVNEVPIQQFYALPYDRWEGYEAERQKLVHFLQDNVKNSVFITTDHHANLVNTVKYTTLEDAGVQDSGIYDFATGPVATMTYAKEIDGAVGTPGSADLVRGAFFKPPPPGGIGMACAAIDVYSYAEVNVTATQFKISFKDLNGKPVTEPGGTPCGPFTLPAR
jgi:phosphodiesterase/alkaline phosphatase D-like protein